MALGYLFLEKFVHGIQPFLEGSVFRSVLSHRKNALVIEFINNNGTGKYLVLDLSPGKETFKLEDSFSYPKRNTTHLFAELNGAEIIKIEIVNK